jgi:hypothetical protein
MKSSIAKIVWGCCLLLGMGFTPPAHPKTLFGDFRKEKGIDIQATGAMDFYSKYIWRGFRLDNDPVFQPSFTLSAKGLALSVWGNQDLRKEDGLSSEEVDTTASYTYTFNDLTIGSYKLSPISVTAGHIYYEFIGTDTFTREYYFGLAYGCFLSPSVTWYKDYGRESQGGGDGSYLLLGLAQSFPIIKDYGVTLDLSGHAGFNNKDYLQGRGGDYFLKAAVSIPLTANLKLSPSINYSLPFGDLKKAEDANQKKELFYGASLVFNF